MPEMTVVNTSPLFYLHRLGLLEVLNRLYGNVTIPEATHHPLALVILDDKLARRIAEMQRFRLTGTAGVLLRAKEKGFIPAIKPAIEKLLSLNFRLKPDLVQSILEFAGE